MSDGDGGRRQVATQGEATRKYRPGEKANSPYATLFPGVAKQAKEWEEIREHVLTATRPVLSAITIT